MIADDQIPFRVLVPATVWNGLPGGADYSFTTSVTETVATWNGGSTYPTGTRVSLTTGTLARRGIYEALASTTNEFPADFPAKWIKVSADEVNKPFDAKLTTGAAQSSGSGIITYTFTSGKRTADSLIVFCDRAYTARVRVLEAVTNAVVYDRTIGLVDNSVAVDAWTYFFAPLEYFRQAIFEDMPAFVDSTIKLTLTGHGNPSVTANEIVIGQSRNLGRLLAGGSVGIDDYSAKEPDTFGNINVIQRAYSDTADFPIALRIGEVDAVRRYLAGLRAKPCAYHAGQEFVSQGRIAYGFFSDLNIEFTSGPVATATLTIEGLT